MEKRRLCAQPGCDVVLSRYNAQRWCSPHARLHPPQHASGQASGADSSPSDEVAKTAPDLERLDERSFISVFGEGDRIRLDLTDIEGDAWVRTYVSDEKFCELVDLMVRIRLGLRDAS